MNPANLSSRFLTGSAEPSAASAAAPPVVSAASPSNYTGLSFRVGELLYVPSTSGLKEGEVQSILDDKKVINLTIKFFSFSDILVLVTQLNSHLLTEKKGLCDSTFKLICRDNELIQLKKAITSTPKKNTGQKVMLEDKDGQCTVYDVVHFTPEEQRKLGIAIAKTNEALLKVEECRHAIRDFQEKFALALSECFTLIQNNVENIRSMAFNFQDNAQRICTLAWEVLKIAEILQQITSVDRKNCQELKSRIAQSKHINNYPKIIEEIEQQESIDIEVASRLSQIVDRVIAGMSCESLDGEKIPLFSKEILEVYVSQMQKLASRIHNNSTSLSSGYEFNPSTFTTSETLKIVEFNVYLKQILLVQNHFIDDKLKSKFDKKAIKLIAGGYLDRNLQAKKSKGHVYTIPIDLSHIKLSNDQIQYLIKVMACIVGCDSEIIAQQTLPFHNFYFPTDPTNDIPRQCLRISRLAMISCIIPCLTKVDQRMAQPMDFVFCDLEPDALIELLEVISLTGKPTIRIGRNLTSQEQQVMDARIRESLVKSCDLSSQELPVYSAITCFEISCFEPVYHANVTPTNESQTEDKNQSIQIEEIFHKLRFEMQLRGVGKDNGNFASRVIDDVITQANAFFSDMDRRYRFNFGYAKLERHCLTRIGFEQPEILKYASITLPQPSASLEVQTPNSTDMMAAAASPDLTPTPHRTSVNTNSAPWVSARLPNSQRKIKDITNANPQNKE